MRFPGRKGLFLSIGLLALPLSWDGHALAQNRVDPASFGFPVPVPEPALPEGVDRFDPPFRTADKTAPAIAEMSSTADRGEVVSMTGVDLHGGTTFEVFSQAPRAGDGVTVTVAPLAANATAATLALPEELAAWSMYLLWPRREGAQGAPLAINRTEAWWVGPEKGAPGERISIYGRNLATSNGTKASHVYLKPAGGPGLYLKPVAVNPFKVDVDIPDLPAGTYDIWMHNGHGGRFGWSGPLKLDVVARSRWAMQEETVVDVARFGATADGVTDDTGAIMRALQAAGAAAPATLSFAAGTYLVSETLVAPDDVTWLGAGMDRTEIRLRTPLATAMIASTGRDAQFRHLTFNADGRIGRSPLLVLGSARNIRLDHVRLDAWGAAALDAQDADGLVIQSSELIEDGSFYGNSRQVFLSDNRFRMTGDGESVVALWGGHDFSMTGNTLTNADESREDGHGIGRFFVAQTHRGSMRNLYWGGNVSRNAGPRDCEKVDCNKGEQICFEIYGSRLMTTDLVGASGAEITFRSLADMPEEVPGGRDLVIVGGRGAGQHRHIVSGSGSTVRLEKPWTVMPDATSRFALAAIASRAAIYDNSFEGRASYSAHDSDTTGVLLYGSVYDVVVDSNRISRMRHGMMTVALDSTLGLSPYFLQYSNNLVVDSNSGLYVGTTFAADGVAGVWGGLGNVYRKNRFERIAYIGIEYETWDHDGSDFAGTVFDRNSFSDVRFGLVDGYKLMWTHDGQFKAAPGHRPKRIDTVLYHNRFERGTPRSDGSRGFVTMHPDNSWVNVGSTWDGFETGNTGPASLIPGK
ncbi:glycosyl hydrolase family 28-related protein [Rhizobium sp. NFR03]|uniref:glycosyl hydrolase family 28-related protein n=1 Tax=Rhizobium sp. NFR03 TaxID=1566263 RepID=UPI0008C6D89C|nr:glycosyl hydrolase family 28-related protein [Rhizobium sp. NFR03]SES41973.1 Polygalacturonase [Rhizobium sp. NFR03]